MKWFESHVVLLALAQNPAFIPGFALWAYTFRPFRASRKFNACNRFQ